MIDMIIFQFKENDFKDIAQNSLKTKTIQQHILMIKQALVYLHSPKYHIEYPDHTKKHHELLVNRYTYMFKCLLAARDGQLHT